MRQSWYQFFSDPILRGPTLGCMLMCLAAALVGVVVFLRRQSLLGESLSHAAYPGVVLGIAIAGALGISDTEELWLAFLIMGGAFTSALIGLWAIGFLERRLRVKTDAALCFVLSAFFGIGLTIASQVQFSYTMLFRQAQSYLFGQAATMNDTHIKIYAALALAIMMAIYFLYKELQIITFDHQYAKSLGVPVETIKGLLFILVVLAVVIGIRSVGVVLMSAMLITPAAAARQFSNKLYIVFPLAAFFGMLAGFFGNYFSFSLASFIANKQQTTAALPTGPMIVIVAAFICLLALFFAPQRGILTRAFRIASFRFNSLCDNVMKTIWRFNHGKAVTLEQVAHYQSASRLYLRLILANLCYCGWLRRLGANTYVLTHEGEIWGAKIVRLHRLWEVYLVDYLGMGAERVHHSAEEMEHILTPELEQELVDLLHNPKKDPHSQPIPNQEIL